VDAQGIWSLVPSEAQGGGRARLLRDQRWVVVDVETTGGSIGYGHRVIEVGVAQIEGGRITSTYETLVNPDCPVPRVITSLTGITQHMIDPAPRFPEVCERISEELAGRVFVGHNVGFDWRFVASEIERSSSRALTGPRVCTLRMARRLLPHLRSRSLGSLAEYFGIGMDRHHRALDDAVATAHLLLRFLDMLEEREITEWLQLQEFFRARPPRKRRRRRAHFRSADAA
jgi:DNA polymerase III subunit epsilon